MKVSENFDLRELVAPDIFEHPAIGERAYDFINCNTVRTLENLRSRHGPITINNWHTGGNYKSSGLRSPDSSVGAKYSSHRFGCGFDLKFSNAFPLDVYNEILSNQSAYKFISRMENANKTITWLHIEICTDQRNGEIKTFNP